jgi:hypothetical protein
VRINPHAQSEKNVTVNVIAVEKIAIIKIPALAGIGYGLWTLVNWKVVSLGQHGPSLSWLACGVQSSLIAVFLADCLE